MKDSIHNLSQSDLKHIFCQFLMFIKDYGKVKEPNGFEQLFQAKEEEMAKIFKTKIKGINHVVLYTPHHCEERKYTNAKSRSVNILTKERNGQDVRYCITQYSNKLTGLESYQLEEDSSKAAKFLKSYSIVKSFRNVKLRLKFKIC